MTCEARREQDEMFCARCDLRWDFKEDPVGCGKYKTGRVLRNLDNRPS